jgi:ureidoglycolate hydrolase
VTVRTHLVKAEPLTAEGFRPFGTLIRAGAVPTEAREGDALTLDVIHYEHRPFRIDHVNRHHHATQSLIPLDGGPCCIVVGAASLTFTDAADLEQLRAFLFGGSAGVNLAIGTWHAGPWPLLRSVDLVNLQGRDVLANDNEVAYLERDLGVVVGVQL